MSRQADERGTGQLLVGGPFDGERLDYRVAAPASVILEGPGVPEGYVARYRFRPKTGEYVFKGVEFVEMRIPMPPVGDAA